MHLNLIYMTRYFFEIKANKEALKVDKTSMLLLCKSETKSLA